MLQYALGSRLPLPGHFGRAWRSAGLSLHEHMADFCPTGRLKKIIRTSEQLPACGKQALTYFLVQIFAWLAGLNIFEGRAPAKVRNPLRAPLYIVQPWTCCFLAGLFELVRKACQGVKTAYGSGAQIDSSLRAGTVNRVLCFHSGPSDMMRNDRCSL